MRIVTRYYSTRSGAGRIRARAANGIQKTIPYDHAARDPHKVAARALCDAMGLGRFPLTEDRGPVPFPSGRVWHV